MSAIINNDYQTNLLFKQFTGVAATQLDQQFSNEPFRSIKNIFSRDIFIEEIPEQSPISIFVLDNSGNWADSVGTAPSFNSTINNSFSGLFPDSHLEFYKNISLTAVPGSNSRVWRILDSSNNNILQDTINFKFDDVNSSYLMRVKYSNGTVYLNNSINSFPLFWLLDNQSGYLQFYASTTQLASNANIPSSAPKISYLRYVGKKGLLNLDISGQQQVVDISGLGTDVSGINLNLQRLNRMILPDGFVDISGSDYDLCGNEVVRTYYTYNRKNMFIGYENLPILDGSAVNHSEDPSHNNITYELDVSGNTYINGRLVSGFGVDSSGNYSVGFGSFSKAYGEYSLVAGVNSEAIGRGSFAHGFLTKSIGTETHSEGFQTEAVGNYSHAQGDNTKAIGNYSHSSGKGTIIGEQCGTSMGKFNDISNNVLLVVGCGTSGTSRKDSLYITADDCVTHINKKLDISGDLIVSGHTQLQDVSCNNLDVSGNLNVFGDTRLLDVSCNNLDVSGNLNVFGHTQLLDVSCNNLDVSGNLNVSGHTQLVDVSCNNLDVGGNLNVSGHTQLADVSCNNLEVSGNIVLWQDMSMNGGQITFIGDATDASGVPSWGQVENAIADLSANNVNNYWSQNGTSIYYDAGNVGIGTQVPTQKLDVNGSVNVNNNALVKQDVSSNRLIVYQNDDLLIQEYERIHDLSGLIVEMSPMETNTIQHQRYDASQYPSIKDPSNSLTGNSTTILVPIAICPVSSEQFEVLKTSNSYALGFNASAFFTVKLYDGSATNSRIGTQLGQSNVGRSVPLQQINFIAGIMNTDNNEGGVTQIQYEKIPFIKVLSNINLGNGLIDSSGAPASQLPYYIDGLELWEDATDIFQQSPNLQKPYIAANGTTYLMLRLSANTNLQILGIQPMFSELNCFYDIRMYKNHSSLNNAISSNVSTPPAQPNDWKLLTTYQQLWLLGNTNCKNLPKEWETMLNNHTIFVNVNFAFDNTVAPSGSQAKKDYGNWFGNLAGLNDPNISVNIKHLKNADVSLKIWLKEPYGITNTKEVFMDDVKFYGNVDILGGVTQQNGIFETLEVNDKTKLKDLCVSGISELQDITGSNLDLSGGIDVNGNGVIGGELIVGSQPGKTNIVQFGFIQPQQSSPVYSYYKIAEFNSDNDPNIFCSGVFDLTYWRKKSSPFDWKTSQVIRFAAGGGSTGSVNKNIFINVFNNISLTNTVSLEIDKLIIQINDTTRNSFTLYANCINVESSFINIRIYENTYDRSNSNPSNRQWKISPLHIGANLPSAFRETILDLTWKPIDINTPFLQNDQLPTYYSDSSNNRLYGGLTTFSQPVNFTQNSRFERGIDLHNNKLQNVTGILGKNQTEIGNNYSPNPSSNNLYIESLKENGSEIIMRCLNTGKINFITKDYSGSELNPIQMMKNPSSFSFDMYFNNNSIYGVRNLGIKDLSATNIDISMNLNVNGLTSLNNNVDISGNIQLSKNINIVGNLDVSGNSLVNDLTSNTYIKVGNPPVIDLSGTSGTITGLNLKIDPSGQVGSAPGATPGTITRCFGTTIPAIQNSSAIGMSGASTPWNDGFFGNSERIIIRPSDWMAGGPPNGGGPFVGDRITWYKFGGNLSPTLYKTLKIPPTGNFGYPYWVATAIIPNGFRIKTNGGKWRVNTVSDNRSNFNGQVGYSQWEVFVSYVSTSTSQSNSSGCSEMLSIGGRVVGSTLDRDNYNNPFNSTITTAEKTLTYGNGYSYVVIRSKLHIVLSNAQEGIASAFIDIERY